MKKQLNNKNISTMKLFLKYFSEKKKEN